VDRWRNEWVGVWVGRRVGRRVGWDGDMRVWALHEPSRYECEMGVFFKPVDNALKVLCRQVPRRTDTRRVESVQKRRVLTVHRVLQLDVALELVARHRHDSLSWEVKGLMCQRAARGNRRLDLSHFHIDEPL
jgi:hypothetical protein